MVLKGKKLAWYGLGILLFIALCFGLCGAKDYAPGIRPYEIMEASKCKAMVDSYNVTLKAEDAALIEITKTSNPQIISLESKATLIRCISEERVSAKIVTKIKVKIIEVDPKTKAQTITTACGTNTEIVILEKKGAFISLMPSGKNKDVPLYPCE